MDSAASDRKKAETLANEREAALKNSRNEEATQILSDAKTNAQNTSKEIVASANEDAAAIRRKKANVEAAKAKSDALDAVSVIKLLIFL